MSTAEITRSISSFPGAGPVAQTVLALLAMAVVAVFAANFPPAAAFTTTALLYVIIVVLLSLNGSFVWAALASVFGALCLAYLFVPPVYLLDFEEPLELLALAAFLMTALVITRLVAKTRSSLLTLQASIDARQRAEAATQRQAALLNLTHDTVVARDLNDVITFWNRGAQELYGWTSDEVLGRVTHELLRTEFPAPLEAIMAELHRTGRWEGELVHTRRDGTKVTVASRWSLQRDTEGRPLAILTTNNDITARKRADEALLRAQAELAHVTRVTTVGELAASIAHEINQPLAAIVADANAGLNWLAMQNPDLARVRTTLRAIAKDGERTAQILTRIRGMLSPRPQPYVSCDLNEVIGNVLLVVHADFARQGIHVQTSLESEGAHVIGDCIQLEQVLLNLLVNAAEASKDVPQERRVLRVSARLERNGREPHVVVAVQDSGVGIRDADLASIFQTFYTTKPGGLGMGLSISRSIIERHGGRLWATPNVDHGATFHFSLPAAP
jgi:PAS domain S-box-containing protein